MTLLASFFLLHLSLTCTQNCVILASTSNTDVSHYKHSHSLLHEVVVDESWHDGDGAGTRAFVKDLGNVLVLDTDHVLSVHLTEEVVNEEAIAGGRGREGGRKSITFTSLQSFSSQCSPMFRSQNNLFRHLLYMYFTNTHVLVHDDYVTYRAAEASLTMALISPLL